MQSPNSLLALALLAMTASCAQAQPSSSTPRLGGTSGTVIVNPRPAATIGLSFDLGRGERPVISAVAPGSPAAAAGLAVGDTLLSIDGGDTATGHGSFRGATPGRRYTLRIRRGGEEREVILVAGPPPAAPRAP